MRTLACLLMFCACVIGWGSVAFAQNITIGDTAVERTGDGHDDPYQFAVSKADCESDETFTFSYSAIDLTGIDSLQVWIGEAADCTLADERNGSDASCQLMVTEDDPKAVGSSDPAEIVLNATLIANSVAGVADCIDSSASTSPHETKIYFLLITDDGNVPTENAAVWSRTEVDLLGPAGVTDLSGTPADSSVTLEFDKTGDGDVDQYQAYCFPKVVSDEEGGASGEGGAGGATAGTNSEPGSNPQGITGGGGSGGAATGGGGAGGATGGGGSGGDATGGAGGAATGGGEAGGGGAGPAAGGGGAGGGAPECETGGMVQGEPPPSDLVCGEPSKTLALVTGLDNAEEYAIGVAAVDQLGNPGALSNVICVQPIPVDDFFKVYREAGGQGGCIGGCAVADRSLELSWLIGALVFVGALIARRRRAAWRASRRSRASKASGIVAGLLLVTVASPALADGIPDTNWRREHRPARPPVDTQFAFEMRFAPYWPAVDSEPGLSGTPYESTFGNDPLFYFGLELDYMPLRIPYVGTLGAAVGWGYTWVSAFALKSDCTVTPDEDCESTDETSLEIMPMHASLVLRADELMRRTGVPLVPYGKFGFGWAFWSSSKTAGVSTVDAPGEDEDLYAEDVTIGLHAAVGLALALNILDAQSAGTLRESTGVAHAYLFAEWMNAILNGFDGTQMHVGTSTFVTGLAIDF